MRKLFTLFLVLTASVGTMFAASGTCGDNLTWDLTDGILTINGTGVMPDFNWNGAPWYSYRSSINEVSIGNGITSIGNYAFYECCLTSVTIPNSVTSIGDGAFNSCKSLTSLIIPNSVTSIGKWAFSWCSGLTSIDIASSVTSIAEGAFSDCTSLTTVTIPNSAISIGEGPFQYCTGLTSIIVEKSNPIYDSRDNCNAIIEKASNALIAGCKNTIIPNSVTSIGNYAFSGCMGLTFIDIPNSVTSIGRDAFSGCTGLTSIDIPNSITSIGIHAFASCTDLTSIIVEKSNPIYDSRDNCNAIIEKASNTLVVGCQNSVIPNSVTSIGIHAFSGCTGLTSIEMPNSVTSIGNYAFSWCPGLTSIDISNSVTSIGNNAFYGCSGLTSITIPNSVINIGICAFIECINLTSITNYATTPQVIEANVFLEVNLSVCTLYVPKESVTAYAAADVWKEFYNIQAISAQAIDNVESSTKTPKVLHNGQILIVRGNHTYFLTGQQIK